MRAEDTNACVLMCIPVSCRLNIGDLLSGLETLCTTLVGNDLSLEALPVLALWEHVSYHVARQLLPTLLCRLLRATALIKLGLLSEAARVIGGLIQGIDIPGFGLTGSQVICGADGIPIPAQPLPPLFNNHLLPGDTSNKKCIEFIADSPVHEAVSAVYGAWLCCQLTQARAAWLMAAGRVPNFWANSHPVTAARVVPVPVKTDKPSGKASKDAKDAAKDADAAGVAPAVQLPEANEGHLLETAANLLMASISASRRQLGLQPLAFGDKFVERPSSSTGKAAGKGKTGGKKTEGPKSPKTPGRSLTATNSTIGGEDSMLETPRGPLLEGGFRDTNSPRLKDQKRLLSAQHCHAAVCALLQLSHVDALRWQPTAALLWALEAAAMVSEHPDLMNGLVGSNEDIERYSCGPDLWLKIKLQVGDTACVCVRAMGVLCLCVTSVLLNATTAS